jgi:hypothetical protein
MLTFLTILFVVAIIAAATLFLMRRKREPPLARGPYSEKDYLRHYEAEKAGFERLLGPMHDIVGHSIIPFALGGGVDLYYFPNGIPGVGFATMELIDPSGNGPKPNRIGVYELVAFTKHKMPADTESVENHSFHNAQQRIYCLLTTMGHYSYNDVLNPGDTCEIPGGEDAPNMCLIFDEYKPGGKSFEIDGKKCCLLLCLEVFPSEMKYAREYGSDVVLQQFKEKGFYPYSDLDRAPVF